MDIEKDSNCKLFVVNEESIKYFNRILDGCKDSFSYYKLGEEIASFNEALYDSAVREVALSSNPISLLVDEVEVEQFRKISDTHRAITLRKSIVEQCYTVYPHKQQRQGKPTNPLPFHKY